LAARKPANSLRSRRRQHWLVLEIPSLAPALVKVSFDINEATAAEDFSEQGVADRWITVSKGHRQSLPQAPSLCR